MVLKKPKAKKRSRKARVSRQLLPRPIDTNGVSELCDWLEISVLTQNDKKVSRQEVIAALALDDRDEAEAETEEIWDEIKSRAVHLADKYPFQLTRGDEILTVREGEENTAYKFCLFISFFGLPNLMGARKAPAVARLFERLCAYAAEKYVKDGIASPTRCLYFGSPRIGWAKKHQLFSAAVDELISQIADGRNRISGVRNTVRVRGDGGDGGLDVIAWRPFPDERKGQFILLGQCAAAHKPEDYLGKITEVKSFLDEYVEFDFPLTLAFFLPHTLSHNDDDHVRSWEKIIRHKQIPFDRVRIAMYGSDWSDATAADLITDWKKKVGHRLSST